MTESVALKTAMFGAGCFWGVEAAFRAIPGVVDTSVGYCGGHTEDADYKSVCTGETGHAEVVNISYDPSTVSYEELLARFFDLHDPTQLNRQGPDIGTQYRSAIFFFDEEHKEKAQSFKEELQKSSAYNGRIVTTIELAGSYHKAEEYHQRYLEKNGLGSCHI